MRQLLSGLSALGRQGIRAISEDDTSTIAHSLRAIRVHLNMEISFISEIVDGKRFFRHVDTGEASGLIQVGASDALDDSYCARVLDGRLPALMHDARLHFEAAALPITHHLPVGAHLSVPVRLPDGRIYGTFCCFSRRPDESLTIRDLDIMHAFAEIVGMQIHAEIESQEAKRLVEDRIQRVLDSQDPSIVYQPIYRLSDHRVIGLESLSRFAPQPYRPSDVWFAEAAAVNCSVALETKAIGSALQALDRLPKDIYLSVNATPQMITSSSFSCLLGRWDLRRIVVEITEHAAVDRYEDIVAVIHPLQEKGLRLAVDDAGAGYASFRHILNLQPDIIKLDISITRAIDVDRAKRALAGALVAFARETSCSLVAEGVETDGELATLRTLGIASAQGHFLSPPAKLNDVLALLCTSTSHAMCDAS